MIIEVIAAVIVGGLALGIVLEPLLRRRPAASPVVPDLDEPEETPRSRAVDALKEIEFDRQTGKLSDADYQFLMARYTAQAVEAMRAEESAAGPDSPLTADVESIIEAKVRAIREGLACPRCGPRPEADAVFCSSCGSRLPTGASCAGCGSALAPGSKFCEECGRKVAA